MVGLRNAIARKSVAAVAAAATATKTTINTIAVACGVGFAGLLAFVSSLLWIRYVIHEDFLWGAVFRRAGL